MNVNEKWKHLNNSYAKIVIQIPVSNRNFHLQNEKPNQWMPYTDL